MRLLFHCNPHPPERQVRRVSLLATLLYPIIFHQVKGLCKFSQTFGLWEKTSDQKEEKRGVHLAAGGGLEPPLPDPESGVLPLDDPATLDIIPHFRFNFGLRIVFSSCLPALPKYYDLWVNCNGSRGDLSNEHNGTEDNRQAK